MAQAGRHRTLVAKYTTAGVEVLDTVSHETVAHGDELQIRGEVNITAGPEQAKITAPCGTGLSVREYCTNVVLVQSREN